MFPFPQQQINMNGIPLNYRGRRRAEVSMHSSHKRGGICCVCCCDYRIAVLTVDSMIVFLCAMSIISQALPEDPSISSSDKALEDDEMWELIPADDSELLANSILAGVGVFAMIVPIYGALKYHTWMIAFGILWLLATFVAYTVINATKEADRSAVDFLLVLIATCFAIYPHVGMIAEVEQGILTEATYFREQHSCWPCCSKNASSGEEGVTDANVQRMERQNYNTSGIEITDIDGT